MPINWPTEEHVTSILRRHTVAALQKKTPRDGATINLRGLLDGCIRAIYYEMNNYPTKIVNTENVLVELTWLGAVGDLLHKKMQDVLGLTEQPYTEKLYKFKSFAPLVISCKCDGYDTNTNILYEFKTKDKDVMKLKAPIEVELWQGLLLSFFFRKELNLPVAGYCMVYIDRGSCKRRFFYYNLMDITDPMYIDVGNAIAPLCDKIQTIRDFISSKEVPPMTHPFIKTHAYGKVMCLECPYMISCRGHGNTIVG
jgi:hypothetical protein